LNLITQYLSSSNVANLEILVDSYLSATAKTTSGLHINPNAGPIFQSGSNNIEKFIHDEVANLPWLLTRESYLTVNYDHLVFWSWCVHLVRYLLIDYSLPTTDLFRKDDEWADCFINIVDLVLAPLSVPTSDYISLSSSIRDILIHGYVIAGPVSYAVLEGILRRKNSGFVNKDGTVHTTLPLYGSKGNILRKLSAGPTKKLTRINYSTRLFEKDTCLYRGRRCIGLNEINDEIVKLYPGKDAYDRIDEWRNDLVHGNQYWQNKVPIILNLICLLLLDEIGPSLYNANIHKFQSYSKHKRDTNQNRTWIELYASQL
jgi:hypothetical protein